MAKAHISPRGWPFRLVFAAWLATALPIALFSLVTFEMPLQPRFSSESTAEGTAIWALFAAWFYITPVVLSMVTLR
jgi:hypothetical protein